jgi:hypothetical protein
MAQQISKQAQARIRRRLTKFWSVLPPPGFSVVVVWPNDPKDKAASVTRKSRKLAVEK